jgi:single-strand DNA-binding protein
MARGVNKAILIGNLGQDPELRYTGSGTAVCTFSIATNESYEDRDGNLVERTEWHNIETWGRTAENCNEYLSKGRTVFVEGKLQTDSWEDRDGNSRKTTKIRAFQVQFLGSGQGQSTQRSGGGDFDQRRQPRAGQKQGQQKQQQQQSSQNNAETADEETFEPDDDLPF